MDNMMGRMADNWLTLTGIGILMLVFAMLALIPLPSFIILGVLVIIIWTLHGRSGAETS